MSNLTYPKHSADLEEIYAAMKIYYESDDWVTNEEFIAKLKQMIDPNQYPSSYPKKAQVPEYFGFIEWKDFGQNSNLRRLTENGRLFFEAWETNDKETMTDILMDSLETTVFGRDNYGCPGCNSDIEIPAAVIRLILDLGYLTWNELSYATWSLEDHHDSFSSLKEAIVESRDKGNKLTIPAGVSYTDNKSILALNRWDFLEKKRVNNEDRIYLPQSIKDKFGDRLGRLVIYTVDKVSILELIKQSRHTKKQITGEKDFSAECSNYDNLIVYGVPGSGKSHYVDTLVKSKNTSEDNVIRTVFYPDYSNSDFIGQILPTINGDNVEYVFNPGPFTLALKQSYEHPNEPVFLIIEEINRGDAAAIFGEIFQLLDRDSDGVSRYGICNVNMIDYLKTIGFELDRIKIPSNLSILATMNTSDQNVFSMDSAFKRRWNYKKIKNDFTNHPYQNCYIPCKDRKCTWKEFVESVNNHMLKTSNYSINEDRFMGSFFVEESLLIEEKAVQIEPDGSYKMTVSPKDAEKFAYKVLEYLWNDVAKLSREEWFKDPRTLDDLIEDYVSKGLDIFADGIFNEEP